MHRPGRRGACRGARWPAGCSPGSRTRDGEQHTSRADTDAFGDSLYSESADFDVVDRVARSRGARRPAAQVALAWLLHQPGVTAPIVGATKARPRRRRAGRRAARADRQEMLRLEEPYVAHPVRGHG